MSMEKILALAKKLKALSERGVGGEKDNAVAMLQSLMKKHSITMDMLNENDAKEHTFRVEEEKRKFFTQVVASVLGKSGRVFGYRIDRSKKKHLFVTCTPQEAIEIQAKFDFFWNAWQEELSIFYSALFQAQGLYTKPSGEPSETKEKELTPEEKAKIMKILSMMQGVDRKVFSKQISN